MNSCFDIYTNFWDIVGNLLHQKNACDFPGYASIDLPGWIPMSTNPRFLQQGFREHTPNNFTTLYQENPGVPTHSSNDFIWIISVKTWTLTLQPAQNQLASAQPKTCSFAHHLVWKKHHSNSSLLIIWCDLSRKSSGRIWQISGDMSLDVIMNSGATKSRQMIRWWISPPVWNMS